jgi:hypothetical protein
VVHCATLFDGLIAEAEGRPEHAIAQYRAALPGLDQNDTHLFAHAARHRWPAVGGDEGAAQWRRTGVARRRIGPRARHRSTCCRPARSGRDA